MHWRRSGIGHVQAVVGDLETSVRGWPIRVSVIKKTREGVLDIIDFFNFVVLVNCLSQCFQVNWLWTWLDMQIWICCSSSCTIICRLKCFFLTKYCLQLSSAELRRAGSGLLDKVITDTRSLKQIPLTEFSSDKDSSKCSFKLGIILCVNAWLFV